MAKKQTYASRAKTIMKKYEPRLGPKFDQGDALALEAMNQELTGLQQEQEQDRVRKIQEEQTFQEEAVQQFQDGGKLNKRQQATLSTLLANRNTPFVQQGLQGQPFNPQAGVNAVGQSSVGPQQFSGSELPAVQRGQQNLGQVGIQQNAIPFGSPRDARQFARRAPRLLDRLPQQQYGGLLAGGSNRVSAPIIAGQSRFAGGGKLPRYQLGGSFASRIPYQQRPYTPPQIGSTSYEISQQIGTGGYPRTGSVIPNEFGNSELSFNEIENTDQGYFEGDQGVEPWMLQQFGQPQGGQAQGGLPQIATPNPYQDPNIQFDPLNFDQPQGTSLPPGVADYRENLQQQDQSEVDPYKFRAPWFGAAATGIGSILGNRQLKDLPSLQGVEDVAAQEVSPQLVDYRRGREQVLRERDLSQAEVRRAARGRGTQQGLTQSTIAGATATQRVAGQQFTQSQEAEQNKNALIRNQAEQFNAQQRAQAGQTNLRTALQRGRYERENALINASRRTNQIAGVTGAISGYGRDLLSANYATGSLRLGEDPEFPIQQRNDAWWKRGLGVGADPFKVYTGPQRNIGQIQTGR